MLALTAKCSLNAVINPKEVEASSFSLWRYRIYIYYCCGECWSIWKCWLCGTSSKYGPSFIAQFSTNQLALSPGSPARPPNSGDEIRCDEIRFVCSLTWYFASVVCVEAVSDTTSLHVKHISAGRSHGLAGKVTMG